MKGAGIMAVVLLSGCVGGASRPMPLAESGPVAVNLGAASYIADLQPGERGAVLALTRDASPFGYDEGAEAKRAAVQFCASRKARLNPGSYGHFVGGAWLFRGGCA